MNSEQTRRVGRIPAGSAGDVDAALRELASILFEKWVAERKTLLDSQQQNG